MATSSTDFAPNTVDDAMSTSTLAGNEVHLRRVHRQVNDRLAVGQRFDRGDLAHLHAAHLDLGVRVHHQAGALRDHGHRHGFGEGAPKQADRDGEDQADDDDGGQSEQGRQVVPSGRRPRMAGARGSAGDRAATRGTLLRHCRSTSSASRTG